MNACPGAVDMRYKLSVRLFGDGKLEAEGWDTVIAAVLESLSDNIHLIEELKLTKTDEGEK